MLTDSNLETEGAGEQVAAAQQLFAMPVLLRPKTNAPATNIIKKQKATNREQFECSRGKPLLSTTP